MYICHQLIKSMHAATKQCCIVNALCTQPGVKEALDIHHPSMIDWSRQNPSEISPAKSVPEFFPTGCLKWPLHSSSIWSHTWLKGRQFLSAQLWWLRHKRSTNFPRHVHIIVWMGFESGLGLVTDGSSSLDLRIRPDNIIQPAWLKPVKHMLWLTRFSQG